MQPWSGLALPLGLPDSEYNFCLLLIVFPQRTPLVRKSLGCPVRDLHTEGRGLCSEVPGAELWETREWTWEPVCLDSSFGSATF